MSSDNEVCLDDIWKQCDQALGKDPTDAGPPEYDETVYGRRFSRKRSRSPPRHWWHPPRRPFAGGYGDDDDEEESEEEQEQEASEQEASMDEEGEQEDVVAADTATGGQGGRGNGGTRAEEQRRRTAEEQRRRRAAEEQERRAAEEQARRAAVEQARRAAAEQARRAEEQRRRAAEEKARCGASERSNAWRRLGKRLKSSGRLSLPLAIRALNGDEALRCTFELPYPESKVGEQDSKATCNRDYVTKWFGIMIDTRGASSGATDGVTRAAFEEFVSNKGNWMKLDDVRQGSHRA